MANNTLLLQATLDDFVSALHDAIMPKEKMQEEVLKGIAPTLQDLADIFGITCATISHVNKLGYFAPAEIKLGRKSIVYDIEKAFAGYKAYKAECNKNKSRYA